MAASTNASTKTTVRFTINFFEKTITGTKGVKIGRPQTTKDDVPAIFLRHYPAYKTGYLNITELSRVCDLSRTTIYKYISLLES